jgi:hypothetical protein
VKRLEQTQRTNMTPTRFFRAAFTALALLAGLGLVTEAFARNHAERHEKIEKASKTEKTEKAEKPEKQGKNH